jgi:signal transduction histidine kinase
MGRILTLGLWLLGLGLWAGTLIYIPPVSTYLSEAADIDAASYLALDALSYLALWGLTTTGAIIILRSANRRFGWLMLATGFAFNLSGFTENYGFYALLIAPEANLPLAPLAAWVQNLWVVNLSLLFVYMPLLFPDGKLPSPRWRPIFWFITLYLGVSVLAFAFLDTPLTNIFLEAERPVPNPFGIISADFIPSPVAEAMIGIFALLFLASMLAAISSLVFRWRGGSGEVRQQIKWLLYMFGLLVAARVAEWVIFVLFSSVTGGFENAFLPYFRYAQLLALVGLEVALGIAILKYRLYDIDLIINRTLVYGGLTLIIVLGYILLVSGLGALLPDRMGLLPSLIATGILAVLFAPIRDHLQRGANRLVYGERQQPYEVMRTLGAHLESTFGSEHVLPAIAETIVKSLKFPYVSITLQRANDFAFAAEYGRQRQHVIDLPLYHQAKLVGYLSVCLRDGEKEMAEQDQELLSHIALWLGPVAQASTLTQELRQSHARLVSARAEERRRLYRDLHDGLGPTLASQTLRFDHALEMLPDDPQAATKILCDLKEQTQGLVLEIRRLVYALRSSTLDELGLIGSLREAIEGFRGSANGLRITLDGDEQTLRLLPAAHEQAAERIALEALTNVIRHAHANCCHLVLELQEGPPPLLHMTIEDDGRGLRPGYSPGVGIASMIKRAEALGGSLNFETNRPQGTRIVVKLPFPHDHHLLEQ